MPFKEVAVSAAVGKQVYSSAKPVILRGIVVDAPVSATTVAIRDGYSSGDVFLTVSVPSGESLPVGFGGKEKFDKGMHVKVIGTNSKCYLEIE